MSDFRLAVVIPTRNRPRCLTRCVESILQSRARSSLEAVCRIYVIDDGRTLDSWPDVKSWLRKRSTVTYLSLAIHSGAAAARNIGIEAAKEEWIAFVDDDCVVATDWFDRIAEATQDPTSEPVFDSVRSVTVATKNVPVIGGDVLPQSPQSIVGRYLSSIGHLRGPLLSGQQIVGLATANLVARRGVLRDAGGFNEKMKIGSEDTELVYRLSLIHDVGFNRRIRVYHDHDMGLIEMIVSFIRYGYSYQHFLETVDGPVPTLEEYKPAAQSMVGLIRRIPSILRRRIERIDSTEIDLRLATLAATHELALQIGYVLRRKGVSSKTIQRLSLN